MGIFKLKPTRTQFDRNVDPIMDLDALIAEPVAFRWNGETHFVRPMDTRTFLKVTQEMARCQSLAGKTSADQKEVITAYARVFESVCDTISLRDVYSMTQAQVGALFQMIVDCVTGRAQKKTQPQTKTQSPA